MKKDKTIDDEVEKEGHEMLFKQTSELGEVMGNLDSDEIDEKTGMSSIDFNTRLKEHQRGDIMIIDELIRLGILPKNIGVTRQMKRLSVSLNGMGREEKVRIVAGDREQKQGMGFGQKLKNLFTPQG